MGEDLWEANSNLTQNFHHKIKLSVFTPRITLIGGMIIEVKPSLQLTQVVVCKREILWLWLKVGPNPTQPPWWFCVNEGYLFSTGGGFLYVNVPFWTLFFSFLFVNLPLCEFPCFLVHLSTIIGSILVQYIIFFLLSFFRSHSHDLWSMRLEFYFSLSSQRQEHGTWWMTWLPMQQPWPWVKHSCVAVSGEAWNTILLSAHKQGK